MRGEQPVDGSVETVDTEVTIEFCNERMALRFEKYSSQELATHSRAATSWTTGQERIADGALSTPSVHRDRNSSRDTPPIFSSVPW